MKNFKFSIDCFNKWASSVVILASIGLLCFALVKLINRDKDPIVIQRVCVSTDLIPDSTKAYNYLSSAEVEALISSVREYDNQLYNKYQTLVEKEEDENRVFYWVSLIVGIVISIFGWFGYSSFNAIEEKAKVIAKDIAKDVAKGQARQTSKEYT